MLENAMNTLKKDDSTGNSLLITYTQHADDRMIQRGILRCEVEAALAHPISSKLVQNGRQESQFWIFRSGQKKLLRVISEGDPDILIITAMVTSKFEKYGVSE